MGTYNNPAMVRVLLLADTHLGFDFTFKPRVQRRRRGEDFFKNFQTALKPALHGEVDLVVHGGDLFRRSRNPDALVEQAMAPLTQVASAGVPVFLVPGNHERSKIPLALWSVHPNLYIFQQPGTFRIEIDGLRAALSGIPFTRKVRDKFKHLVRSTGYREVPADLRLLCLHEAVEGAQVGPVDFTFRDGPDVIRGWDIPTGFAAVLSGHIHRAQHLKRDLNGAKLPAPVIYPGSVERTAFAERYEVKGYVILEFSAGGRCGNLESVEFVPLPARPMVEMQLIPGRFDVKIMERQLEERLAALDPESIVRIRILDGGDSWVRKRLTAQCLRKLAPSSMNVSLAWNGSG